MITTSDDRPDSNVKVFSLLKKCMFTLIGSSDLIVVIEPTPQGNNYAKCFNVSKLEYVQIENHLSIRPCDAVISIIDLEVKDDATKA